MFGLESPKKKKANEFIFDLERDLKTERASIKRKVESRIQEVNDSYEAAKTKKSLMNLVACFMGILRS